MTGTEAEINITIAFLADGNHPTHLWSSAVDHLTAPVMRLVVWLHALPKGNSVIVDNNRESLVSHSGQQLEPAVFRSQANYADL